jgi:hypothetical protein
MRNARGRDVAAFGIADNRAIAIFAGKAATDIIRNVRRRIVLKYFCECNCPLSRRLAPGDGSRLL